MYGPKWQFLLMYRSHNMRHSIPQVDGLSTGLPGFGVSQVSGNLHVLKLLISNLET